jgi:hypothetical protein
VLTLDRDIGSERVCAGPVDHYATSNHQIVHA